MAADELVALLDRILSGSDRLADGARVEKIKTIGDAYMVAGGLPEPRPDHLEAVARMALAMLDEVAAIAEETGRDWLAAGSESTADQCDLWGDTVNTASRMESQGLPGQIHIIDRVAAALGPGFVLRPRGTSDVKGKGPMTTFLLDGAD